MPSGVYERTEEARKNISKASMGRTPWNKGKTNIYTKETRYRMGSSKRGKPNPQLTYANLNREYTAELRRKMSERQKGEKGSNWQGGIGSEKLKARLCIDFRLWREKVYTRDDYTCKKCGIRGGKLHPHHIENFAYHIDKRYEVSNGITLCEKCHREFHKLYGLATNDKYQLREWLGR